MLCNDEFANSTVWNVVVEAVVVKQCMPAKAQSGLVAGWSIVQAGMNHFAIATTGLLPDAGVSLQYQNFVGRKVQRQHSCQRQPNDTCTDDADVY